MKFGSSTSSSQRLGHRDLPGADEKEIIIGPMGAERLQETAYTGVPAAPRGSLPLLAKDQKRLITARGDPPAPKDAVFDASRGMPLFWQERKAVALWKRLLENAKGQFVFDLAPVSGARARCYFSFGWCNWRLRGKNANYHLLKLEWRSSVALQVFAMQAYPLREHVVFT